MSRQETLSGFGYVKDLSSRALGIRIFRQYREALLRHAPQIDQVSANIVAGIGWAGEMVGPASIPYLREAGRNSTIEGSPRLNTPRFITSFTGDLISALATVILLQSGHTAEAVGFRVAYNYAAFATHDALRSIRRKPPALLSI